MGSDFQVRVRERAHQLWLQAGCPEGRGDEHWQQAERDIHNETSASPAQTDQPIDADQLFASSHALEQTEVEAISEVEDCTIADVPDLTTPSTPLRRKGTTLLKAGFRQCRYIISETYSPAICCGAPTNGGSWCEEHRARVLVRSAVRPSRPEQRQPSTP
jgi:hypothetical protein